MTDADDDLINENRRRLAAVTLLEGTLDGVWSRVSAHIAADDTLVISGHVLGPGASFIGDELEYWVKVEQQHLGRLGDRLATLLGTDPTSASTVTSMLKLAFERGEFETGGGAMQWLTENGIPSSFSSWP